VRVAAGPREFDTLVEGGVCGDAVEVEELKGAEAKRDRDRLCETLVRALEEALNAGVEGDLPAKGSEDEGGGEVAIFGRELCGVGGVEEVVAISLPCGNERQNVEGCSTREGDGFWLMCEFWQAAFSCLRILFCMVWFFGRPFACVNHGRVSEYLFLRRGSEMNWKRSVSTLVVVLGGAITASAQAKLPVRWEELTGADFVKAIQQAQGTCILPIGILEKHGPHMPIGSDLLNARYVALHAAEQQYAVVFPEYYFGQIAEARQEPGTVSYSRELQLALMQATTDEMGRNGCKKILIVNGHGGNNHLLPYFAQTQLEKPHDYVVYLFDQRTPASGGPAKKTTVDQHAGESETSKMLIVRPDLVHMDRAKSESGDDQHHLNLPDGVYTGIWWYARFPDHYAGDGSVANKELGDYQVKWWVDAVSKTLVAIKADNDSLRLQKEFYEKTTHPLDTPQ
jgi:creatinine amidohydrolase